MKYIICSLVITCSAISNCLGAPDDKLVLAARQLLEEKCAPIPVEIRTQKPTSAFGKMTVVRLTASFGTHGILEANVVYSEKDRHWLVTEFRGWLSLVELRNLTHNQDKKTEETNAAEIALAVEKCNQIISECGILLKTDQEYKNFVKEFMPIILFGSVIENGTGIEPIFGRGVSEQVAPIQVSDEVLGKNVVVYYRYGTEIGNWTFVIATDGRILSHTRTLLKRFGER